MERGNHGWMLNPCPEKCVRKKEKKLPSAITRKKFFSGKNHDGTTHALTGPDSPDLEPAR